MVALLRTDHNKPKPRKNAVRQTNLERVYKKEMIFNSRKTKNQNKNKESKF